MTDKIIELIKKGYSVDIYPGAADSYPEAVNLGTMCITLRKYDHETKNWYKDYAVLDYNLYSSYYNQSINERIVWVLDRLEEQMKLYKSMVKKEIEREKK